MKHLVMGVFAHVDAGKTTLSEALLYQSGTLRTLGRVDHQNAFLDTDSLERQRGITIFSKEAVLTYGDLRIQLLDTPGHVDFGAEAERTISVLDYAVLVISASDGVQGHTRTLWHLLQRHQIPTFVFVNKMDLVGADKNKVLAELQTVFADGCLDVIDPDFHEQAAMMDEVALSAFLEEGELSQDILTSLVRQRKLFPCVFGAALKLEGVAQLLDLIADYTLAPHYGTEFGAQVYKITRDPQGNRLTHLKVTGGNLVAKQTIVEPEWSEKADQLRLYSGVKFEQLTCADAGMVCAVTGLTQTKAGDGLGAQPVGQSAALEPVLTYHVNLPDGVDPHTALQKLRLLEEQDPQLHLSWNEPKRLIQIQLMGAVQLEVLAHQIQSKFGWEVTFGTGAIVYRETIADTVIGVGHFEPLRHYAEVVVEIAPLPNGSGVVVENRCSENLLSPSWQRLVCYHLRERVHLGVLSGHPLTDVKITLLGGRGHDKHTEGGDFRQATYRAVRQGLMQANSILLEPWYDFTLDVPSQQVGRAMGDVQLMGGKISAPNLVGEEAQFTGSAPVVAMTDYATAVASYTKGLGRLRTQLGGFAPCAQQEQLVAKWAYDPEADLEHTPDSVFCTHGAGFTVKWHQVPDYQHTELDREKEESLQNAPRYTHRTANTGGSFYDNAELQAIFERTYGKGKTGKNGNTNDFRRPMAAVKTAEHVEIKPAQIGEEYLLVDGYNMIFAWDALNKVAQENLDVARKRLMDMMCNYQGVRNCHLILVFDAYKVARNEGEILKYHNIHVVYTKESQTADAYIEKATYDLAKKHHVRVASSDNVEQLIITGHGAIRVSADMFWEELQTAQSQMRQVVDKHNQKNGKLRTVSAAFEKAKGE
ncbi:TetM/TetW/TetO/TetS family tetracycline resistance ribosomal protection protein [Bengtsoniella intestinalis]|uniref:NYN domain-containing protein n=1 Tax=Bengtsoniella intestinalis TaxID=3073143 RepID=UPI00391F1DA4